MNQENNVFTNSTTLSDYTWIKSQPPFLQDNQKRRQYVNKMMTSSNVWPFIQKQVTFWTDLEKVYLGRKGFTSQVDSNEQIIYYSPTANSIQKNNEGQYLIYNQKNQLITQAQVLPVAVSLALFHNGKTLDVDGRADIRSTLKAFNNSWIVLQYKIPYISHKHKNELYRGHDLWIVLQETGDYSMLYKPYFSFEPDEFPFSGGLEHYYFARHKSYRFSPEDMPAYFNHKSMDYGHQVYHHLLSSICYGYFMPYFGLPMDGFCWFWEGLTIGMSYVFENAIDINPAPADPGIFVGQIVAQRILKEIPTFNSEIILEANRVKEEYLKIREFKRSALQRYYSGEPTEDDVIMIEHDERLTNDPYFFEHLLPHCLELIRGELTPKHSWYDPKKSLFLHRVEITSILELLYDYTLEEFFEDLLNGWEKIELSELRIVPEVYYQRDVNGYESLVERIRWVIPYLYSQLIPSVKRTITKSIQTWIGDNNTRVNLVFQVLELEVNSDIYQIKPMPNKIELYYEYLFLSEWAREFWRLYDRP